MRRSSLAGILHYVADKNMKEAKRINLSRSSRGDDKFQNDLVVRDSEGNPISPPKRYMGTVDRADQKNGNNGVMKPSPKR